MAVNTDLPPDRGEKQDEIVKDEIEDRKDDHNSQVSTAGDSGRFTLKLGVVIFVCSFARSNRSARGSSLTA